MGTLNQINNKINNIDLNQVFDIKQIKNNEIKEAYPQFYNEHASFFEISEERGRRYQ